MNVKEIKFPGMTYTVKEKELIEDERSQSVKTFPRMPKERLCYMRCYTPALRHVA